ncbi:Stage V sporulation protein SpoVK [Candidatus Syntrophocurvum alkaliphilum]|uniref:Stage V sporulation protein SpoVK n=1 Tax=Candidatus Syntrophocurvum alkaliphilum TaxID=2293317 RepID=A0A6I6DAQ7_9FIRM|nr:AAA family ATPase [Candidatus Syntrophocurvum alkaliphilum]QGT99429.1 Stage V sporulation protein SpoVK [Candidatus Syntrophocurvum alkaliphilum]
MKFTPTESAMENVIHSINSDKLSKKDSFKDLEKLIGLKEVKKIIAEISAFALVQKKRSEQQLKAHPIVLHMVFKGNPGTGKTTLARLLGLIMFDIGVLSKGHLIEVERADLVGEYIGHTAQKTKEMVNKSIGGILFIDEAYTLAQGGEKDFGKEAIATIVKAMEDHRENLIVILAGYRQEMDLFIRSNPGLRSRFPIQIEFPDYDSEQLFKIAVQMYNERDYELSSKCRWKLKNYLNEFVKSRHPHSGNARFVRNLVEKSIRLQALRLVDKQMLSRKELMTIEDVDLPHPDCIEL